MNPAFSRSARAATIARARDIGILRPLWRRAEIALARDRAYLARLPMQQGRVLVAWGPHRMGRGADCNMKAL